MTSCETTVETWELPRESNEWVGPIDITLTADGATVPITSNVYFAVLAPGVRPPVPGSGTPSAPWALAVDEPGVGTALGVTAAPVASPATYGIWATAIGASEQPVLQPNEVGFIKRT